MTLGQSVARRVASPETQLRSLKRQARKVVKADGNYALMLGVGTDAQLKEAQSVVWNEISTLRRMLDRYDGRKS